MTYPQFGNLFFEKYHPLVKGISIAFETTFSAQTILSYPFEDLVKSGITEKSLKALIYRKDNETIQRVYNPAYRTKTIPSDRYGFLVFIPLVEEEEALFHRVCFRYKNDKSNQKIFLARFDEDDVFTFPAVNLGWCVYLSLNFLGKGATKFKDLYIKVVENGIFSYYKISAVLADEGVVITTDRVDEKSAPPHLKTAR